MKTGRDAALAVLVRVIEDRAYASAALEAELARSPLLGDQDKALCSELVYGTLRHRSWLENQISSRSDRGLDPDLDVEVRASLLMAAYQIIFLDRVPAYAAVSSAVEQIKKRRGFKMAGFANALLRRISTFASTTDLRPPAMTGQESAQEIGLKSGIPTWLISQWAKALGLREAGLLAEASNLTPPAVLRVTRKGGSRQDFLKHLKTCGVIDAKPCRLSPLGVEVPGRGDPAVRASVSEGFAAWQDEGAQLGALALGARPGERILDACAGRGGKTGILADLVGMNGLVVAADIHPGKLKILHQELLKQNPCNTTRVLCDFTSGTGLRPQSFDRILLDAPCTGDGTLRRRPDLKARLDHESSLALCEVQRKMLENAARLLRPGGTLLYMVCSLIPEQGPVQVQRFLETNKEFKKSALMLDEPFNANEVYLLPHKHGTDGFYCSSFRLV